MKSFVIYGSRHGNTRRIADAIAEGLRAHAEVVVLPVEEAPRQFAGTAGLVVIGGPTEGHGMSEPVRAFLGGLKGSALKGVAAAAFDTRLDWPRWMSGSAGARIGDRLRELGADVVAPHGSFLVEGKDPALKAGELDRAVKWGDRVGRSVRTPVAAAK